MPSNAFTSAGTTIKISSALPNAYTLQGFSTLQFVEIAEVTDLGEFGREFTLVTHNPLASRRTVKRKGSFNDGAVTMQLARTPSDPGQDDLLDARDSDDSFAFMVELQDGTRFYFTAQVMSYTINVGSADQIVTSTVTLEIDNDILEDAAGS